MTQESRDFAARPKTWHDYDSDEHVNVCPACHGKLGQFVLGMWRKCIRCDGKGWVK